MTALAPGRINSSVKAESVEPRRLDYTLGKVVGNLLLVVVLDEVEILLLSLRGDAGREESWLGEPG